MNSQEFAEKFSLPIVGFSAPVFWTDGVGFSIIQKGTEGYSSIYKIGVNSQNSTGEIKRLWVSVSYGKETSGGISLGTGREGLYDPVDVDSFDDYSYDGSLDKFFFHHNEIRPKQIILDIEKIHKHPTLLIKGLPLRLKLWFWRKFIPGLLKFVDIILISLLWGISGERITGTLMDRIFNKRYVEHSNRKIDAPVRVEESTRMDFFGYKAKRWSVVFYCSVSLSLYAIYFFFIKHRYLFVSNIFKNNFLTLCYIVVTFAITEWLIPKILKLIIVNYVPEKFTQISFKRIKLF